MISCMKALFLVPVAVLILFVAEIATANPYSVLGVSSSDSDQAIKARYHELLREFHPDVNSAPDATTRTQQFNDAFAQIKRERSGGARTSETRTEPPRYSQTQQTYQAPDYLSQSYVVQANRFEDVVDAYAQEMRNARSFAEAAALFEGIANRSFNTMLSPEENKIILRSRVEPHLLRAYLNNPSLESFRLMRQLDDKRYLSSETFYSVFRNRLFNSQTMFEFLEVLKPTANLLRNESYKQLMYSDLFNYRLDFIKSLNPNYAEYLQLVDYTRQALRHMKRNRTRSSAGSWHDYWSDQRKAKFAELREHINASFTERLLARARLTRARDPNAPRSCRSLFH